MKLTHFIFTLLAPLVLAACVALPPTPAIQIPAPAAETPAPARETSVPGPSVTSASIVQTAPTSTMTLEDSVLPVATLMNATYSGIYDAPVTLTEGSYEGAPFEEGGASRPTVQYVKNAELYGDLNGDGVQDAVVFLLENSGGSGVFTYVAAQLNRDARPVDAGAVWVEDRIGVKSAVVEDGQVVLDIITQGPGDGACCGTHNAHKTYALQNGRLVDTTGKGGDLVKVSAADLEGTKWTLLEVNEGQPAPADAGVTLSFGDGQFSGSGGCNNYTGSFSLGDPNPFIMTMGPIAATQKSCPEPILGQETAYLTELGKVTQWSYVYGRLALYYADGQGGISRMLFAPQ
jgi:heat shock protein HslJ